MPLLSINPGIGTCRALVRTPGPGRDEQAHFLSSGVTPESWSFMAVEPDRRIQCVLFEGGSGCGFNFGDGDAGRNCDAFGARNFNWQ